MPTIQSLTIELDAKFEKVTGALSAIQGQVKAFENTVVGSLAKAEVSFSKVEGFVNRVGGALTKFASVAAGGVALGGFSALIKGAMDTGDRLGDMATRLESVREVYVRLHSLRTIRRMEAR
jgi:hypothetical protein